MTTATASPWQHNIQKHLVLADQHRGVSWKGLAHTGCSVWVPSSIYRETRELTHVQGSHWQPGNVQNIVFIKVNERTASQAAKGNNLGRWREKTELHYARKVVQRGNNKLWGEGKSCKRRELQKDDHQESEGEQTGQQTNNKTGEAHQGEEGNVKGGKIKLRQETREGNVSK